MAVSLLTINPVILLHCVCYLFVWASLTTLLYFYFLLPLWVYWLVFLSCQLIGLLLLSFGLSWPIYLFFAFYCSHEFIALFLGLSQPIYYIFTSYHSYELVGHYFCLVSPLSLPLYSLGFLSPFTFFFLLLIVPIGLPLHSHGLPRPTYPFFFFFLPLVTFMGLLAIILHWAYYLIFLPFCPSFFTHFPYCWASSAIEPSVKSGHQQ